MNARKKSSPIDRPFDADILRRAREIAGQYRIIVWREEGDWFGHGLELPDVYGDGRTPAKCIENTLEALTTAVAYLLEQGRLPPSPAQEGARTEQVNVRLSAEEKRIFEAGARRRGFKGLGDFFRAAAAEYAQ